MDIELDQAALESAQQAYNASLDRSSRNGATERIVRAYLNARRELAQGATAGTLERAVEIATAAHAGQEDKAGEPYVAHPLRVMLPFVRAGDETRAIIAVLHDVVEDSHWTLDALAREGFGAEIVVAIQALTRPPDEAYLAFVARAAANELARPVKVADLRDNLCSTRLARLPGEEREKLLAKYAGALTALGEAEI